MYRSIKALGGLTTFESFYNVLGRNLVQTSKKAEDIKFSRKELT
jgi:hypothetical protein